MDLNRRTLLKMLGLTAAGSALPGCERDVHNLVPYLLPDDHHVPGVATWYATTCQECEAGCGILARVIEGRVKKLEGNPGHPINKGKLCAMGQAGLQGVYNPDRLTHPLIREGERGEGHWRPITWEEGIATWVAKLQSHRGSTCLISKPVSGTLATLFDTIMGQTSGKIFIQESREEQTLRTSIKMSLGRERLPYYDLARADYLVSFGTPFLEQWLSPVAYGIAFGEFRQGRPTVRGRFIQIEPRLSLTAANADQWIPITPGTEGLMAAGIGQILIKEGLTRTVSPLPASVKDIFFSSSLDDISAATDISSKTIHQLAREIASARTPVFLGGGPASSHTNSTVSLAFISALNVLLGNVDQPGGLQWRTQPAFPIEARNMEVGNDRLFSSLADAFAQQDYTLLHLYRADPLFTLPPSTNFGQVFSHAQYIVSFSSFLDDSTSMADLILPDHDPLESWSDHVTNEGSPQTVVNLSQPVIRPLYDTRAIGDVWLEAARQLGEPLASELPWSSWKDMIQATWMPFLQTQETDASSEDHWRLALQRGGYWPDTSLSSETSFPPQIMAYDVPQFIGEVDEYPFYFYPYPSLAFRDGRGANRPWLQELPDPLTTKMWGSWVEINPVTARNLNIQAGDIARVTSPYGSVDAPVVLYPGLRPDMLAMPLGQGHRAYGRYAKGRGSNPLTLIAPVYDAMSGSISTGATRVAITRLSSGPQLPMLEQPSKATFNSHFQQTGGL